MWFGKKVLILLSALFPSQLLRELTTLVLYEVRGIKGARSWSDWADWAAAAQAKGADGLAFMWQMYWNNLEQQHQAPSHTATSQLVALQHLHFWDILKS